jgi:site-specific recombinase XerD
MEQLFISQQEKLLPISVTFEFIQTESFKRLMKMLSIMEIEKIQKELDDFKKDLVLHYSLRDITIKGHLGNIKRMLYKIQTINPTKEEVTDYVYWIRNSDKSTSHMCNNISSVEKYMDFKRNLIRFAKPKRITKLIIDVLTEAEISRMINICRDIKEKSMIIILAYTGMRNRSFCELKVKDIDFGNNVIFVKKAKGKKEYPAYLPSEAIRILSNYIQEYGKKENDFLFTTKLKNNQYATSDIRRFIKILGLRAKIEKRTYPHLLRHALASNMRGRGADIILIKEQLGQDWIESTMTYLSRFPNRIKAEFEVYKPAYL